MKRFIIFLIIILTASSLFAYEAIGWKYDNAVVVFEGESLDSIDSVLDGVYRLFGKPIATLEGEEAKNENWMGYLLEITDYSDADGVYLLREWSAEVDITFTIISYNSSDFYYVHDRVIGI